MKRPVPVILCAILLGLFAAIQLLFMVLMIVAGAVFLKQGVPSTAGPQPFPPSMLPFLMFGLSVFSAAIAVWMILTLIGLVRLRSWARYSVLVIAGLMVGFGGLSMLTSLAMPFLMPSLPATAGQPAPDSHMMGIIFFTAGTIYGLVAVLGIALLVYFNRANTRAIFQLSAPVRLGPPKTFTGRERPTAVTVISWMYLISAPFCLIYVFLPLPTFLLGFVLRGMAAHLTYAAFAILGFAIGYGLYRLREEARIKVFVLSALCPIQLAMLLSPWGRRQFTAYLDAMNGSFYTGQLPAANPFATTGMTVFMMVLVTAFLGVILWLLHRHREAFTPAPPAPPMPPQPELAAGLTS